MTIGAWLAAAEDALTRSGDADARADGLLMLCQATGLTRSMARLSRGEALDDAAQAQLESWLQRRLSGEPLQYILGVAPFMGYDFLCDARALIPRFDTETLCDGALTAMRGQPAPSVLDLCCGTGAIGLSVALKKPDARVTLADLSEDALALARENAERLGAKNVCFRAGDLFGAVPGARYDYILCNPPYLTQADMADLQAEVRFEPAMALCGGRDGLDFYRRIAGSAPEHLLPGGAIFLEVGMGQAGAVGELLLKAGLDHIGALRDLNGVERVVTARRPSQETMMGDHSCS